MDTRFEAATPFGQWIKAKEKTVAETAQLLGVTRSHVWKLAVGKAVPSAKLMAKIQAFTFGEVPMTSWASVVRKLG